MDNKKDIYDFLKQIDVENIFLKSYKEVIKTIERMRLEGYSTLSAVETGHLLTGATQISFTTIIDILLLYHTWLFEQSDKILKSEP